MTKKKHQPNCSCGGIHYEKKDGHKIDAENVLGLNNPWAKTPTKEDLKICKKCWFEARNGHAMTCPDRENKPCNNI